MSKSTLFAIQHFDALPDSARVRVPVVCAIYAVSPATVWRWTKCGRLPKPHRDNGVTSWSVREIRRSLSRQDGG